MFKTVRYSISVPVSIFKERAYFIAYSPALDLSTSAKSFEEVTKRFKEIVQIFIEEIIEKNTLDKVLANLGWQKHQKHWIPPLLVSHESASISIPLSS